MNSKKIELFEKRPIPKAVAALSIPTVLATLVMVLYNTADTIFVGMLDDSVESSAVTFAGPVLLAFNAVNNLFGIGSSSLMSRSLGKYDYDTVKKTSAFSFYCALASAIFISLLYGIFNSPFLGFLGADTAELADATGRYLFWTCTLGAAPSILNVVLSNMVRSEGASLHASLGVMSGCVLNIILDPFFVLPKFLGITCLGMGAAGAGCATFVSNCVACLYFFILLFIRRKTTYVSLKPGDFSIRRDIVKEVFGVGLPASVQNLLNVTGTWILNRCTGGYGEDAVSAMGYAHKINLIPVYLCMGMTQGIMPLVSYNYTNGNRKRMKESIQFVQRITVALSVVLCAVLYIFAGNWIWLIRQNPTIVEYGKHLLRGMCLCIPFMGLDFMAVGVFQATGKGGYAFLFAILRKVVLEIPAILLLRWAFGLYGIGYACTISEVVLGIAGIIFLRKITSENKGTP